MSRLAVLGYTCGFYTYYWDGYDFIPEYILPAITSVVTYLDFSISDDFQIITILY